MGEHDAASGVRGNSALEDLRAAARGSGASAHDDAGWFGRLLRERLARKCDQRPRWDFMDGKLSREEMAKRQIAKACRKAALGGGVCAAGAQAGLAALLTTEGLAAGIGVPSVLAAIAADTFHSAVVQIDLAFDLASIYGVPFQLGDDGELATVFELGLRARHEVPAKNLDFRPILVPNDAELLARVGDRLAREAVLGLAPLVGIPFAAVESYVDTRELGHDASAYVRVRKESGRLLRVTLEDPNVDPVPLLEGAWLLATSDDILTHECAVALAALARYVPVSRRAPLAHLGFIGEGVWIVHMSLLDDAGCRATLSALEAVAALRSKMTRGEQRFLERVSEALGRGIDFARIEALRRSVHGER
jgi:hypothetical protein